jgi:hypothetical protein
MRKIAVSLRFDIFILFLFGGAVGAYAYSDIGTLYNEWLKQVPPDIAFLCVALILSFIAVVTLDALLREIFALRKRSVTPIFMNDVELTETKSDLLDTSDAAARFAAQIWNGGATDSLVFGLDAPWGIGKSTFINFTLESLKPISKPAPIIFKFNPLKYSDKTKLFERLIDGLRQEITDNVFIPELSALLTNYSRLIQGKVGLIILGIKLDQADPSVDALYSELERALARLSRKIVVVIDDLDRIDYSEVKEILFSIKKSFMLPNVSYILCFDTQNVIGLDTKNEDPKKVREFLEKFINIKASLFLDSSKLSDYVTKNFDIAYTRNLLRDPVTVTNTAGVLKDLEGLFKGSDFYNYAPFIGDIRKIKRLINTILSLEIEKTEFENADFDKSDLLNLILIYLNYPHTFRMIYNTETGDRNGFFSAVGKHHIWYPQPKPGESALNGWQNSVRYIEFLEKLDGNQRFLLEKIFSVSSRFGGTSNEVSEHDHAVLACFNGRGNNRNLERYLNLIVKTTKPVEQRQYKFYVNKSQRVIDGSSFSEVLKDSQFDLEAGEYTHQYFWRVFINQARSLKLETVDKALDYLVLSLPDYSAIEIKELELGFRSKALIYLLRLLNIAGWEDGAGQHINNSDSNISNIAHRIFGEHTYFNRGLLSLIGQPSRGPLGLYDLLIFRLYCCANRDNDLFHIHRALVQHEDPHGIVNGPTVHIAIGEMREISQKIVEQFLDQYSQKGISILREIDNLSTQGLMGKTATFCHTSVSSGKLTQAFIDETCAIFRNRLKIFISYQLGAVSTDGGVTCGYYDRIGNSDNAGISLAISEYFFDICFNPEIQADAYESFLDFLLISYPERYHWNDDYPTPTIQSWTRVLQQKSLAHYWKAHRSAIFGMNYIDKDKDIRTSSYTLDYKSSLPQVFGLLDQLIMSDV